MVTAVETQQDLAGLLCPGYLADGINFDSIRKSERYQEYLGVLAASIAAFEPDAIIPMVTMGQFSGVGGDIEKLRQSDRLGGAEVIRTRLAHGDYRRNPSGIFRYELFHYVEGWQQFENSKNPLVIEVVRNNENPLAGILQMLTRPRNDLIESTLAAKPVNLLTLVNRNPNEQRRTATTNRVIRHEVLVGYSQIKSLPVQPRTGIVPVYPAYI